VQPLTRGAEWTAQTFTWPVRARAVAYIQLGDFLEILLHRQASVFAACDFCRSANHKRATRCHVCGSALPIPDDDDRRETFAPRRSDARSLVNVSILVLVPTLLLCAGFAGWQLIRSNAWIPAADPPMRLASPGKTTQLSLLARPAKPPSAGTNVSTATEVQGLGLIRSEPLLPPSESPRPVQGDVEGARHPRSASAPKAASKDYRKTVPASRYEEQYSLAACDRGNVFARAICINRRCAEPDIAQSGQCREAVRQRRIDEARRDPTLAG